MYEEQLQILRMVFPMKTDDEISYALACVDGDVSRAANHLFNDADRQQPSSSSAPSSKDIEDTSVVPGDFNFSG